jgi:hypothetical protein
MLVITAAAVDAQVGMQIVRMISPINHVAWYAWPVVAGMDFKVKLAMIRSLASHQDKAACDYIVECCDKLQEFYQRRNQVAHAVTNAERRSDGRFSFTMLMPDNKKGGLRTPLLASPQQIEDWGRSLFQWSNELEQTLCDLGYPTDPPTEADIGEPPPEEVREARRPKTRIARTIRKRPRPASS